MTRCDFHTTRECGCDAGHCLMQDLGTHAKANDMRGVFCPSVRDLLALAAFGAMAALVAFGTMQAVNVERQMTLEARV